MDNRVRVANARAIKAVMSFLGYLIIGWRVLCLALTGHH
jgi:hypothetical protein